MRVPPGLIEGQPAATEPPKPSEGSAQLRARSAVRCLVFAALVISVWPLASYSGAAAAMVGLSPFVTFGSAIAARAVGWTALVASPALLFIILRRRFFCRWLCPTGLLCDQVGRIGVVAGRRTQTLMPVNQWIAIATLAGAVFGYPVLLWLDPLALLTSLVGMRWQDGLAAASLSAAGLVAVLLLSLIFPGVWCARVCPLGGTQDLLAEVARRVGHRERRMGGEGAWRVPRRAALAGCLGAAWAWAMQRTTTAQARVMRPPAAIDESRFRGVCVRCGNCIRVCPTNILRADLGENGLTGLMCPTVKFDPGYCREDCVRCGDACPSGAIAPVLPNDKIAVRMGIAKIDHGLCLLSEDRECSICKNACPFGAIGTVWSDEEYSLTIKITPNRCPGCGACQVACPTSPRKAITVLGELC